MKKSKIPTPQEIGIIPGSLKLKKEFFTRDGMYAFLDEKDKIGPMREVKPSRMDKDK